MAMPTRTRGILLVGVLVATLAAVVWVREPEPVSALVAPAKEKVVRRSGVSPSSHVALEKLHKREMGEEAKIADVFQAKSWYIPPPPPKPVPPPPPAPPPLPFTYLGKLQEEGRLTVFITKQDRHYAVKTGDMIDGEYRVDSVEAQRVVFTYLPLNMQQTLSIGVVN
jgi:hypothetical protein